MDVQHQVPGGPGAPRAPQAVTCAIRGVSRGGVGGGGGVHLFSINSLYGKSTMVCLSNASLEYICSDVA